MEQSSAGHHSQETNLSRVLISGANGLIGRELAGVLRSSGVQITALTRASNEPNAIRWNPEADSLDPQRVSGFDAVIHLAGEPVGTRRWSKQKKQKIYDSRVRGTAVLAKALAAAEQPPRIFLCASGTNYYPSSGSELLDETAPAGNAFLSKVCVGWEESASLLALVSRVITMRIGVVLSEKGGTLTKLLPAFRWGLGGYAGSGDAYLSWITLNDTVRAMLHMLHSEHLHGPVNVISPEAVTGRAFAQALGHALRRPAFLKIPAALLRLALGEMADETILSSIRAVPSRLLSDGFVFEEPTLERALSRCLAPRP